MSMNKMAIAELVAAVAARVSLVREVAYPSHRRVDCHSPRCAEELGKEEVESHASNVVPMVKNKTSHGREDQERQEGISGLGNDPLVAVIRSRVHQSGVSPCLERHLSTAAASRGAP